MSDTREQTAVCLRRRKTKEGSERILQPYSKAGPVSPGKQCNYLESKYVGLYFMVIYLNFYVCLCVYACMRMLTHTHL